MIPALLLKNPLASVLGVVAALGIMAAGVQTVRLAWVEKEFADDKRAQADAVRKLQAKAESLSNELVIEQAKAMAKTAEKETIYVDRVKRIPVAPGEDEGARTERMRAGSSGVRAILCGERPEAFCTTPAR